MVYLRVIQSCWRLYESLFSGMLTHHFVDIQVTSFDIVVNFNLKHLILVVQSRCSCDVLLHVPPFKAVFQRIELNIINFPFIDLSSKTCLYCISFRLTVPLNLLILTFLHQIVVMVSLFLCHFNYMLVTSQILQDSFLINVLPDLLVCFLKKTLFNDKGLVTIRLIDHLVWLVIWRLWLIAFQLISDKHVLST